MSAVPIRLRGPKGISTITVELDGTVEELQHLIFSATEVRSLSSPMIPYLLLILPRFLHLYKMVCSPASFPKMSKLIENTPSL